MQPLQTQGVGLPLIPDYATNNAHIFYLVCTSLEERTALLAVLKAQNILAVFHYLSLHKSAFYTARNPTSHLPWADHYTDCLLRLPLYYELSEAEQNRVIDTIRHFYGV